MPQEPISAPAPNQASVRKREYRNASRNRGLYPGKPRFDLGGKRFGKLVVVRYIGSKGHHAIWLCDCDCGKTIEVRTSHLTAGQVSTCGCGMGRKGNKSPRWKGFGEISGIFWKNLLWGAKARNIEVGITIEIAWDLYLGQGRRCALSGLEINFGSRWGEGTASLDRIDNDKGYL